MAYVVVSLIGMCAGAFCAFVLLESTRKRLDQQQAHQKVQASELKQRLNDVAAREQECTKKSEVLKAERTEFESRAVSYKELGNENLILKRDLRNIDLQVRKLKLDHESQRETQDAISARSQALASRYLKDNVKWITSSLGPNNFSGCKQRLQDAIESCRGIGFEIPAAQEGELQASLRETYEKVVRAAFEREEQARIKAQIREEQLRQQEIDRELQQLDREREAIRVALEKAIADAKDQHSEEVERLKARLAEAEERSQRAISQAQLTRSGFVYVISNLGSFGDGVFKIGMTRRLEPSERVKELSNASVPFPYDVHMMISANDAPTLENALHRKLHRLRINKANPRKEFFRTDVETIYKIVKEHHGDVEYVVDAEALQYRESLNMIEDDQEFIESVYHALDDESVSVPDEM